jgi:sulfur transfer protein SufE
MAPLTRSVIIKTSNCLNVNNLPTDEFERTVVERHAAPSRDNGLAKTGMRVHSAAHQKKLRQ